MKRSYQWSRGLLVLLVIGAWHLQLFADQDSENGKWTETGSLLTGRTCNTATLLPNGQVLVVGGHGFSEDLASVELYDPRIEKFLPATNLYPARANHTATLLTNGRVLIVGGQSNGKTLADAEIYDPSKGTWIPTTSLHVARSYHTATLLPDGQVLVVGGSRNASPPVFAQGAASGSALDIVELYNPSSGKWTVVDNLHSPRYCHTSTLLKNGHVLVVGGIGSNGVSNTLASVELYDPATGSWTEGENLGNARFGHGATLLLDGKVLVTGGQLNGVNLAPTELFDPSRGRWTRTGDLHSANGPATLLSNGQVLVSGGADKSGILNSAELYNPATGIWDMTANLHTARMLHTSTLLSNGQVLVAAGNNGSGSPSGVVSSAELFCVAPKVLPRPPSGDTAQPPPIPSENALQSLLTLAMCATILTVCLVIFTSCVVILLCAWLVYVLIKRWNK